jgi:hypothetical protein
MSHCLVWDWDPPVARTLTWKMSSAGEGSEIPLLGLWRVTTGREEVSSVLNLQHISLADAMMTDRSGSHLHYTVCLEYWTIDRPRR